MSEACPDCKGTGVYRGLLREGPCPTCTAAIENVIRAGDMIAGVGTALPSPTCTCKGPEGQPHKPGCPHYNQHLWNTLAQELAHSANRSAKCIRPSAEVEADYGLRPGSLAPRPEPLAAGMLDQEIAQPDEVIRELQRENVWSPEMTEAIDAAEQVLDKQPGRMTVGKMLQLLIEKGRIKYEPAADVERKFALPPGTLVECTQPLEPVAQDADGHVKPIDEIFPDSAGWIGLARLGGGEPVESTDHHEIETIIRGGSRAGKSVPFGPQTTLADLNVAIRKHWTEESGPVRAIFRIDPDGRMTVEEILPLEPDPPRFSRSERRAIEEYVRRKANRSAKTME